MIKENWFFDQATGSFNSRITAIAPIMVRTNYNDKTTTSTPICWLSYENIRPYLSRTMLMTSDYNNILTNSMDDFFMKKMYKGEILKTVNMRNQTLAQQVGSDPEALKHAQDSIENQLKSFREQLWVQPDTTAVAGGKTKKATVSSNSKSSSKSNQKTEKAAKPAAQPKSTPSTPTKSVRRTR